MRSSYALVFLSGAVVAAALNSALAPPAATAQADPAAPKPVQSQPLTKLPEDYRAMTIKCVGSPTVGAAGNSVDLICMVNDFKDPKQLMAKTFLQNKLVLAVEAAKEPEHLLVTIVVTPEKSERLARAVAGGPITVIWRKAGDNKVVATRGAATPFGRGTVNADE